MYDLGIYHYNGSHGLPVDVSHAVGNYWEKVLKWVMRGAY
jgi:hypothetical protein